MNNARVYFSDDILFQQSTDAIILKWMYEHKNMCRDTNITLIAKAIMLDKDRPRIFVQEDTICQRFTGLLRKELVYRFNGKRRATFVVNELSPLLPQSVVEILPEDVKEKRKMLERARTQSLAYESAKQETVQQPSQESEAPCSASQSLTEGISNEDTKEEIVEDTKDAQSEEVVACPLEAQKEETATISAPVEIKKQKDGSINLTITLNINL